MKHDPKELGYDPAKGHIHFSGIKNRYVDETTAEEDADKILFGPRSSKPEPPRPAPRLQPATVKPAPTPVHPRQTLQAAAPAQHQANRPDQSFWQWTVKPFLSFYADKILGGIIGLGILAGVAYYFRAFLFAHPGFVVFLVGAGMVNFGSKLIGTSTKITGRIGMFGDITDIRVEQGTPGIATTWVGTLFGFALILGGIYVVFRAFMLWFH